MTKVKKIAFFALTMVVMLSSVEIAKGIESVYPNKYRYWFVSSSVVATGVWNLVLSKSNNSRKECNFTATLKDTSIWQWHVNIPINDILPGRDEIGFSQATQTFKVAIPPLETLEIYERYVTTEYKYLYQEGEVILWSDHTTSFKPYGPPVAFSKTVVSPRYKISLVSNMTSIQLKNKTKIDLVYEDLSNWNLHGGQNDFLVNGDPYENVVVFKRDFPKSLYVLNVKENKIERLGLPFPDMRENTNESIVNGVDVFHNVMAFTMFKTTVSNLSASDERVNVTSQLLLYNYRTGKNRRILRLKGVYISKPAFSMNGKYIAYDVYNTKNNETSVFVMNLKNGEANMIYEAEDLSVSESAWNEEGDICFGVSNGQFVVAMKEGKKYDFSKIPDTEKNGWSYISYPFFISNDIAGFVDPSTSTLFLFDIHMKKVIKTENLKVNHGQLIGVYHINGKLFAMSVKN